MLKVGDTVKVRGTTLCSSGETECIPIGAVCVVTGKEIDEGHGRVYYEIKPKTNVGFDTPFWYLEKDLEKGHYEWIPDE